METDQLDHFVMVGELALTGAVRPVEGVLPIALRAREKPKRGIFVPSENAAEAAVVAGLQVTPVQNLREAVSFIEGERKISFSGGHRHVLPTGPDAEEGHGHSHELGHSHAPKDSNTAFSTIVKAFAFSDAAKHRNE